MKSIFSSSGATKRLTSYQAKSLGKSWPDRWWEYPKDGTVIPEHKITDKQDAFIRDTSEFVGFGGAPGGGKTGAVICKIEKNVIEFPGIFIVVIRRELTNAKDTFWKQFAFDLNAKKKKYDMKNQKIAAGGRIGQQFPNGSLVVGMSGLDDERMQGINADIVVLEEAPRLSMAVIDMVMRTRGSEESRARADLGFPRQIVWTGNQQEGFFKENFADYHFRGEPLPEGRSFYNVATWENPGLSADERASIQRRITMSAPNAEYARKLLNGHWDLTACPLYPYVVNDIKLPLAERDIITPEEFESIYGGIKQNDDVWLGMDWGVEVPTAVLLGKLAEDGTLILFAEFYEPMKTQAPAWLVSKLTSMAWPARMENIRCVPDPATKKTRSMGQDIGFADPMAALRRAGLAILPIGERDVMNGIALVRRAFNAHKIKMVEGSCRNLKIEWNLYRLDPQTGKPASDCKDHALDALRYLITVIAGRMGLDDAEPYSETDEQRTVDRGWKSPYRAARELIEETNAREAEERAEREREMSDEDSPNAARYALVRPML